MEHFQPFMRKMHPQVMLPCRPDEKGRLPSWPLNGKPCLIPELFQIVHKLIGPMSSLGPVVFSSCLHSWVQIHYGFILSCNVAPPVRKTAPITCHCKQTRSCMRGEGILPGGIWIFWKAMIAASVSGRYPRPSSHQRYQLLRPPIPLPASLLPLSCIRQPEPYQSGGGLDMPLTKTFTTPFITLFPTLILWWRVGDRKGPIYEGQSSDLPLAKTLQHSLHHPLLPHIDYLPFSRRLPKPYLDRIGTRKPNCEHFTFYSRISSSVFVGLKTWKVTYLQHFSFLFCTRFCAKCHTQILLRIRPTLLSLVSKGQQPHRLFCCFISYSIGCQAFKVPSLQL